MITTLSGAFGDEAVQNANQVLHRMQGYRTFKELISEYYGVPVADFSNTKKLRMAGVKHTPRLAELGVTKEKFEEIFADVLDFNLPEDVKQSRSEDTTDSIVGLTTESVVPDSKKRAGRPKA